MDAALGMPVPLAEMAMLVEHGRATALAELAGWVVANAPTELPLDHLLATARVAPCLLVVRYWPERYAPLTSDALLAALQADGLRCLEGGRHRRAFRRFVFRLRNRLEELTHVG